MRAVGVMINKEKSKARKIIDIILNWSLDNGIKIMMNEADAQFCGRSELIADEKTILDQCDYLIVLGGDGTLLKAAHLAVKGGLPIFGVNLGTLGFLTETEIGDLAASLKKITYSDYFIEERMMLQTYVIRQNEIVESALGVNDVVITKAAIARLIKMKVKVNSEYAGNYVADGIIIASPTGSTAYSLSAGGPLVTPDLELLLLTPICPHSLLNRPIVISPDKEVEVILSSERSGAMLTVDGQYGFRLLKDDRIIIKKADARVKFIRMNNRSFFETISYKMLNIGDQ